jgi:periplasmic protein TonB
MRTWTLVVSVCAHAIAIAAIIVAPIFATTDLPEPRRPLTFESITPIDVPSVPAPARPQPAQPLTHTQSFPVIEPPDVAPERPQAIPEPFADVSAPGGTGVPGDVFPPVGDVVTAPPQPQAPKAPVPVGGVIRPPTRVLYVEPVYPRVALAGGIEGTVILQAVIDEKGRVREVKVLRSIPLLDDAALQAVAKWQFTPTLLNGTAVPVVMTVTVGFMLKR